MQHSGVGLHISRPEGAAPGHGSSLDWGRGELEKQQLARLTPFWRFGRLLISVWQPSQLHHTEPGGGVDETSIGAAT